MKISFIWQGIGGRYGHWKDGLWRAMKYIENDYEVSYHEPFEEIPKDSIILYWEAPCTINGKDGANYRRIQSLPNKKILLFAGGPIKKEWFNGFDLVCVESKINKQELDDLGIPNITAFGINDDIFKPKLLKKKYGAMHHATCASWKRQQLLGEALGPEALIVGRYQKEDPMPFDECIKYGAVVMDEQPYETIADLLNESHCLVQTSDYWGGGQRATLEAMACGVPPIVMEDSPKNREYVEESGFGMVIFPNKEEIRKSVNILKNTPQDKNIGVSYIKQKWTARHYADNLIRAIKTVYEI